MKFTNFINKLIPVTMSFLNLNDAIMDARLNLNNIFYMNLTKKEMYFFFFIPNLFLLKKLSLGYPTVLGAL